MAELYERIVEQASQHGLTGKELGKLLGLKKSPLTDWKNKKSSPTLEQIITMCEIFAVSSDYLLFGKHSSLSAEESKLINGYRKLDQFGQQRISNFIEDELIRINVQTSNQKTG